MAYIMVCEGKDGGMIRLVVGLFLIVVPVLELAVLVKMGQWIGVWATVALLVITAFAGILIISQQSFTVLRRTLEAVSEGRPPVAQVLDGLFLMTAGALLLTPGFITDVLALLLLVPPVRRAVAYWSMGQLLRHAPVDADADDQPPRTGPQEQRRPEAAREGPVIEGEFERLGETSTGPRRGNGANPS
jgi:UPF0716 protein FxsA